MIGHMKSDGLLGRNWLKGALGEAMHAVLCSAGHNLRMILAHMLVLWLAWRQWVCVPFAGFSIKTNQPWQRHENELSRAN